MCVRYNQIRKELEQHLGFIIKDIFPQIPLKFPKDWIPAQDTYPKRDTAVLVPPDEQPYQRMIYGFVPVWAKEGKHDKIIKQPPYNARSETVFEKPTFRTAIRKRRCLIPATGFYERQRAGGALEWVRLVPEEAPVIFFAAIWEEHEGVRGVAMLTTEPNAVVRPIHNRMPVILEQQQLDLFMDESASENHLKELFKPYSSRLRIEKAGELF